MKLLLFMCTLVAIVAEGDPAGLDHYAVSNKFATCQAGLEGLVIPISPEAMQETLKKDARDAWLAGTTIARRGAYNETFYTNRLEIERERYRNLRLTIPPEDIAALQKVILDLCQDLSPIRVVIMILEEVQLGEDSKAKDPVIEDQVRITIDLDADVIEFYKLQAQAIGRDYRTLINDCLRRPMHAYDDELFKRMHEMVRIECDKVIQEIQKAGE